MKIRLKYIWILYLAIMVMPQIILAKENDPVSVTARSVKINEKNNTIVYSGSVRLQQGDISITADRLIAYTKNGNVETVTASGHPIRIRRKKPNDIDPLIITGSAFKYRINSKKLNLSGSVIIKQGKDMFNSETLFYDVKKDHLIADKDKSAQQVIAIIYPQEEKINRNE